MRVKRQMLWGAAIFMAILSFILGGCSRGVSNNGMGKEMTDVVNSEIPAGAGNRYMAFAGMNSGYSLNDNLAMKVAMQNAGILIDFNSVLSADLAEKRVLSLRSGN